jgi:hypothetical protein
MVAVEASMQLRLPSFEQSALGVLLRHQQLVCPQLPRIVRLFKTSHVQGLCAETARQRMCP